MEITNPARDTDVSQGRAHPPVTEAEVIDVARARVTLAINEASRECFPQGVLYSVKSQAQITMDWYERVTNNASSARSEA